MKHWSPLLATSKAQQLLFRIVDGLLLPHNLTQQDKAVRDSLPLYLQVRTNIYCTHTRLGQSRLTAGLKVLRKRPETPIKALSSLMSVMCSDVSILTLLIYSPAGSVSGFQRVSVAGCLPEAAAQLCYPQISGPFPSCLTFHGHHRQPPSASERM